MSLVRRVLQQTVNCAGKLANLCGWQLEAPAPMFLPNVVFSKTVEPHPLDDVRCVRCGERGHWACTKKVAR